MPQVKKISTLPHDVRAELDARLFADGFGHLQVHTDWLRSLGYSIGRSAVGEYSLEHKSRIQAAEAARFDQTNAAALLLQEYRLRCLEVASRVPGVVDLTSEAGRLLAWVQAP